MKINRHEMKLEDIGFYTLSDERAKNSSIISPLWRCELLLTDRCNFKCLYCRKLENGRDLSYHDAVKVLGYWISERLRNVRFSGGEPTLYPHLIDLVKITKDIGVRGIAISTNGSASSRLYRNLLDAGVNDFSISLDACCAGTGAIMSGRKGVWWRVTKNIEMLHKLGAYVTVGVVLNEINEREIYGIISLADKLGVSDIRIIPAAQTSRWRSVNYLIKMNLQIPKSILDKYPILRYRITRNAEGKFVRGISVNDSHKCKLVLDDMAVWNNEHYPCIIYLREGGKPIGAINKSARKDRYEWYLKHDSFKDVICRNNCLDVCVAFNNMGA